MHYIRELVHAKTITLHYCPIEEHIADIFTNSFIEKRFIFFQNIMDLLADVLYVFNKVGGLIILSMSMTKFLPCGCNGKSYINWGQWLEPQAHLKRVVAGRDMKGYVIAMLKISKDLISCVGQFRIVHSQNMHNHLVDYLCFSIDQALEGN